MFMHWDSIPSHFYSFLLVHIAGGDKKYSLICDSKVVEASVLPYDLFHYLGQARPYYTINNRSHYTYLIVFHEKNRDRDSVLNGKPLLLKCIQGSSFCKAVPGVIPPDSSSSGR